MRKKWWIIIGIIVLIVAGLLFAKSCGKKKQPEKVQSTEEETYTVKRGDISSRIEITGEVQPKAMVSLKSKVSGKIVKFYADENDYVTSGQIIADIEPDYNQANTLFNTKAMLQKAEINLKNARKDLADKTVLLKKQFISQEEYDKASDALQEAEIEYAQASSQYEMIRDLDVPGKVTHVYATSSGVVIERNINEGEMVQSSLTSYGEGTVIMKIADLNQMIIKSNINEVDISKFKLSQNAEISLDALPYEKYEGRVVRIAPQAIIENNAKVFPIEISINTNGKIAKPGMTANVTILADSRENVLVIPIRAVFSNDKNQDIVYLVTGNTTSTPATKANDKEKTSATPNYVSTPIKLGTNDLLQVEVIEGLKEGDIILLNEPGTAKNNFMMM
ncbi:MAG TPA: efflux RND transporter periplasmic adaptor subunit [Candidatus Cloacimonas sp.]|jgi:HlyD family secretion protein|nr:efflux RND transporter periplasmic adaptor subunit [Candidatus Cloacimonas sp.]MDD3734462.1 efflux RND transporter periplasmic adaptor subunit [Candidatus Cloacimonadota bacterium]MCK9164757.1 efflux RND transporter periplasmic adaptor subunit [Candidatus Cloacimonas sp.]MDD3869881.1 efflux RND transporter periplasmic adaptor subunit [Candidatus Cloacimonadota bacterium]MDD4677331.1 efflux RND transporter periplasmic adaptor subunit [Candidatus Cloacimonadota bacterium]